MSKTKKDLSLDKIKTIKVIFKDSDDEPYVYTEKGLNVFRRDFLNCNGGSDCCEVPKNIETSKYQTSSLEYEPDTGSESIFEKAKKMRMQSGTNFE
jgi:hypothetical protein